MSASGIINEDGVESSSIPQISINPTGNVIDSLESTRRPSSSSATPNGGPPTQLNTVHSCTIDCWLAALHQLYQQPVTTFSLIRFWHLYLSLFLFPKCEFAIKQWHRDPRYVVDIRTKGSKRILLTGLIVLPFDRTPRSAYEVIGPIPLTELGLLMPGGDIAFFIADRELEFYHYNVRRDAVQTMHKFDMPLVQYPRIAQIFAMYLIELNKRSLQQYEPSPPTDDPAPST